jgi:hypothetical protein
MPAVLGQIGFVGAVVEHGQLRVIEGALWAFHLSVTGWNTS